MAITIDGKVYRNLQEQVAKNQSDIKYILEEEGVLNQFGVKVVNKLNSSTELPDPTTYTGEYGDAVLVGTTEPYDMYIFTRPFGAETANQWFNIGQFPLPAADRASSAFPPGTECRAPPRPFRSAPCSGAKAVHRTGFSYQPNLPVM